MDEVLKLPIKGYEGKEMDGESLTYLATLYGMQDLNKPEISPDPNAGAFGSIRSNDLLYYTIQQTIKAYHSSQLSYPQFKEALNSLRSFRPDEKLDNLGRLFLAEEVTPNQQLARDLANLGVNVAMAIPIIRAVGGALKYGGIGAKKAVEFLFPQLA
ncbi:MAG: hypothetical protein IPP74_15225, partial [Alphaproteobacteria bacterium]|nr:hypothetical protein [Alphaproteobacteria bacterium]